MSLADYSPGYRLLWSSMTIDATKAADVLAIARRLYTAKDRYLRVSNATGVPWFVVAAIHERESGGDFKTQLAQGDPLNETSTHVPRGQGPYTGPDAWERAAIYALRYDRLDKVLVWNEESCCYALEGYNGFGYRRQGIDTPYLWAWTSHYTEGKYTSDGVFSRYAVDKQCGAVPIVEALMQMDHAAWPPPREAPPPVVAKNATGAGAGAAAGTAAAAAGMDWHWIVAIVVVVALAAWFAIHLAQKGTS